MGEKHPDFSGWATRHDVVCSDGLTIKPGAFAHADKQKVPLMWQHGHHSPENVLGHAYLSARPEGIYAQGFFNKTEMAGIAKEMLKHGDINSLSIFANNLKKQGSNVVHGDIKEVSLVLAGANPHAYIDFVSLSHGEDEPADAVIYTGMTLSHEDKDTQKEAEVAEEKSNDEKTVADVFETLSEEQKNVVYYLIGQAIEDSKGGEPDNEDEEDEDVEHGWMTEDEFLAHVDYAIKEGINAMTRNVFDQSDAPEATGEVLTHSQIEQIIGDAKRIGSLKESFLAHAQNYGIENIDILFPDAKNLDKDPQFIKRRTEWVEQVIGKAKHSPFSRTKTILADITADEARARGYVKNTMKKEEVISLLKRSTTPTTIYKKQKLDRDDIIDITDLDVIAWLKAEMRLMLDEELARAVLIGDGRSAINEDKIADPIGANQGAGIRSIANDDDMYAHKVTLHDTQVPGALIEGMLRSRTHYRGTGTPTLFTTDAVLTDMLLEKDKMGRRIYNTVEELANTLRVDKIVPVEVMEYEPTLLGIMVNMADYTMGTDAGGSISFFDDFDIDWNQHKYLIETRLSGALTKPKSALVFSRVAGDEVIPTMPSFNSETNTITIPDLTGVDYYINDELVTDTVVIDETTTVDALPAENYLFPLNITTSWTFTFQE